MEASCHLCRPRPTGVPRAEFAVSGSAQPALAHSGRESPLLQAVGAFCKPTRGMAATALLRQPPPLSPADSPGTSSLKMDFLAGVSNFSPAASSLASPLASSPSTPLRKAPERDSKQASPATRAMLAQQRDHQRAAHLTTAERNNMKAEQAAEK